MMADVDQKEHFSRVYAYAIATSVGFTYESTGASNDRDSIDAQIKAIGRVNERSKLISPAIELQLKATTICNTNHDGTTYKIPIPIKNYNDLRAERATPAILVVLFLPENDTDWLLHSEESLITKRCAYWVSLKGMPDSNNTDNITIDIPKANVFSPDSLRNIMSQISINGVIS